MLYMEKIIQLNAGFFLAPWPEANFSSALRISDHHGIWRCHPRALAGSVGLPKGRTMGKSWKTLDVPGTLWEFDGSWMGLNQETWWI